jgi:hypothetical protein
MGKVSTLPCITINTCNSNGLVNINMGCQVNEIIADASSTTEIDRIDRRLFCGVKYIVCVFNICQEKYKTFEVLGSKISAANIKDTIYAKLGSDIDMELNFSEDGSDAKLEIVNDETFDLTVHWTKTIL